MCMAIPPESRGVCRAAVGEASRSCVDVVLGGLALSPDPFPQG
jgi:hypothetical protein